MASNAHLLKTFRLADPIATTHLPLHERLETQLPRVREALSSNAALSAKEAHALLRLLAGILVLESLSVPNDKDFDRAAVNKALVAHIGAGYSWASVLQYLSGKRARELFARRTDLILQIGGNEMVTLFQVVLPTIDKMLAHFYDR